MEKFAVHLQFAIRNLQAACNPTAICNLTAICNSMVNCHYHHHSMLLLVQQQQMTTMWWLSAGWQHGQGQFLWDMVMMIATWLNDPAPITLQWSHCWKPEPCRSIWPWPWDTIAPWPPIQIHWQPLIHWHPPIHQWQTPIHWLLIELNSLLKIKPI